MWPCSEEVKSQVTESPFPSLSVTVIHCHLCPREKLHGSLLDFYLMSVSLMPEDVSIYYYNNSCISIGRLQAWCDYLKSFGRCLFFLQHYKQNIVFCLPSCHTVPNFLLSSVPLSSLLHEKQAESKRGEAVRLHLQLHMCPAVCVLLREREKAAESERRAFGKESDSADLSGSLMSLFCPEEPTYVSLSLKRKLKRNNEKAHSG